MEYSASVRCGAPSCPEAPLWRFAVAFPFESSSAALDARPQYRCGAHLDLAGLVWLPDLRQGMHVVLDPNGVSPALYDDERSDTVRMDRHLIDVDELRPRRPDVPPSVTGDATRFMPAVTVPGQLALTDTTDR